MRNDDEVANAKSRYNATPLTLDLEDQSAVTATLLEKQISAVFFLISAFNADAQVKFIEALAAVKGQHSVQTYFLHTTGAKLFSSFTGHPTDRVLSDAEEGFYGIEKTARSKFPPMETVCEFDADTVYHLYLFTDSHHSRRKARRQHVHLHPMLLSTAKAPASATVTSSRLLPLCVLPEHCVVFAKLTMKMA